MALWYITGRSGTGKTSKVYSQIKEALNRGEEGDVYKRQPLDSLKGRGSLR